jgi:hypothetical protein
VYQEANERHNNRPATWLSIRATKPDSCKGSASMLLALSGMLPDYCTMRSLEVELCDKNEP